MWYARWAPWRVWWGCAWGGDVWTDAVHADPPREWWTHRASGLSACPFLPTRRRFSAAHAHTRYVIWEQTALLEEGTE